jgi:hypothetical protein
MVVVWKCSSKPDDSLTVRREDDIWAGRERPRKKDWMAGAKICAGRLPRPVVRKE